MHLILEPKATISLSLRGLLGIAEYN